MRILVTGSRAWKSLYTVETALWSAFEELYAPGSRNEVTVVHGGSRGADALANYAALKSGWTTEVHPADWDRYGKSAGHRRNAEMVAAGADICLAFPLGESRGTRGCMALAAKAGIEVVSYGDEA